MEHTQGQWKREGTFGTGVFTVKDSKCVCMCHIQDKEHYFEAKARANLIAAAPDLLAMCKLAAKYVSKMVADDVKTAMPPIIALNRIEAAIAKAEGAD